MTATNGEPDPTRGVYAISVAAELLGMDSQTLRAVGHRSLDRTLRYAKIANRTVADEHFAVTDKVEALYGQPQVLPADAIGPKMVGCAASTTGCSATDTAPGQSNATARSNPPVKPARSPRPASSTAPPSKPSTTTPPPKDKSTALNCSTATRQPQRQRAS